MCSDRGTLTLSWGKRPQTPTKGVLPPYHLPPKKLFPRLNPDIIIIIVFIHAVTLSLEPPPNDAGGVLFFEYCPTGSVSVNVTCSVEGLDTCIKPQVVIGPDHFYLSNQMKVEKWRIIVFRNSVTLLCFTLPLNDATAGQAISCQSEGISSQYITLQSGK